MINFNIAFEKVGYVFGYFLFTTVLFLALLFLGKFPTGWDYINIMLITFLIMTLGIITKRLLK